MRSKRTDFILDDLFLDYSLPRDGSSFFEAKHGLGTKLANAMKSLLDSATDKLSVVTGGAAVSSEGKLKPQTLIRNMAHTVETFASAISELAPHDQQVQGAAHVFRECVSVCKSFPPIIVHPADDAAKQARFMDFHAFVSKLLPRVRQLAPGTTMMAPAGWLVHSGRQNDELVHGKVFLLVLHRRIDKPEEFTVAICNSSRDQGLAYHPVKPDGSGELRLVPLTLKGVKRERLINGAFWVMLLKSLIIPHVNNGPKWVYGSVLPSLSGVPIDAQLTVFPELAGQGLWLPPAEGGDKSGAICATYALFAILQLSGKSVFDAQWLALVQMRRVVLETVADIRGVPLSTRGLMLRSLAWHACRLKQTFPDRIDAGPIEEYIEATIHAPDPHEDTWRCPALDKSLTFETRDCRFFFFDRVAQMEETDSQAGKPRPPRVLLPVPLAKVRDGVKTVADLRELWADVVHCCALLQNQQSQIPHAQALVFGLVVHAMTRVTPCVTSVWWTNVAMTEDTREFLLRQLHLIISHFAASAFSLGGRAIDGGRIVTSSALMAFCDRLCRTVSTDRPSVFAQHYGGTAAGPVTAFGLGPGILADETACSLLLSPDLVTTRATILDYFASLALADDKELFRFDDRVDFGQAEFQLVEQLCLAMGLYSVIPESPYLLTGEKKDLLTYFPELGWLRDVAFLSKILMNPDGERLPQLKAGGYRMSDAELLFKFDKRVLVKGFGIKQLELCGGYKGAKQSGSKLRGLFFWRRGTGRVYPSMADPSNLCAGETIAGEDDVLHCKTLPKFTSLGRASVERLVTLLTAPYLRIPLLVAFFRDREKVAALAEPKIQAVMDAALFEPGRWKPAHGETDGKRLNAGDIRIPGEPTVLHSSWGLMYNELLFAPSNTIEGLIDLLDAAIERDSGRFGSPSSKVILYACRLACRVARFIDHMLKTPERFSALSLEVTIALQNGLRTLRDKLGGQAWSIVNKWSERALTANKIEDACAIQAHLALLVVSKSASLDWETATVLLGSQAYLSMNHRWSSINGGTKVAEVEETGGADTALGGVYEFELLDVFAATRRGLSDLVHTDARMASVSMDSVVSLLTKTTGLKTQTGRNWITTENLPGVFVPETEAPPATWLAPLAKEGYAAWLLRTTRPLALTVNINLGQFSLTDQQLALIPEWAFEYPHYVDLFGTEALQVAEVKSTTNREWLRIVGHAHDLQRWSARCERAPPSIASRSIPAGHWAGEILFSAVQGMTARQVLPQSLKIGEEIEDRICVLSGELHTEDGVTHRDVIVRKDIATILVFDVVEYGRRWYRRLVWSSDESVSLGDCAPIIGREIDASYELVAKVPTTGSVADQIVLLTSDLDALHDPPGLHETLVISRNIRKEVGEQTLIPCTFLRGVIPDVLLARYRFWQFQDGSLEGEFIPDAAEKTGPMLRVQFDKTADSVKKGSVVTITRERADRFIGNQVLLNLAFAPVDGSQISALATVCKRMDNLAYVLAWGSEDNQQVEEIEFPRLRLSFKRRGDKLFCEQHEGFWLLSDGQPAFSPAFNNILQSLLGASAVLCAANGTKAILVGAHVKPIRAGPGGHTVFSRDHVTSGHFFYPAHLSEEFVTTQSLMAAVHLLRTRWMSRHYAEAVDMIPCVFADTVDEKALAVLSEQQELAADIHPDSYGLRLRLALAILPFVKDNSQIPWDLSETMNEYLMRVRYCSASVRLGLQDERYLLEDVILDTMKKPGLANRLMFLRGVANGMPSVPCQLSLTGGDGWCSSGSVPSNEAALRIVWPRMRSYTRPENDLIGASAVQFISETTATDSFHPMMMVEIACRWFTVRVDDEDDAVTTSACLNRLGGNPSSFDGVTHTLAAIFANPAQLTQVQPIPKKSALDILGNANYNWLKALVGIARQTSGEAASLPESWIPEDSVVCPTTEWPTAPFVSDCNQASRVFTGPPEFGDRPLAKLCERFVEISTGTAAVPNVDQLQQLLDALETHPNANTDLGKLWVNRVRGDVKTYVHQLTEEEQYRPVCPVSQFKSALQAQLDEDWAELRKLIDLSVAMANSGGLKIAQQAGVDVQLGFCALIRMLMSESGESVIATLHSVRPGGASHAHGSVMNSVAGAMFRAVRVGQLLRTLALLPKSSDEISDAQLNKLLRELAAKRFFCSPGSSADSFSYDPRLLGAEFLFGVMFRDTQVKLLNKFVASAANGDPIVHQMIMGAGKTTVLAPLLGMMLATPKRLVVSCVPAALLEFSREVMRERYSSPVLATPVVTFQFVRQDRADESVLRKLKTARTRRAVVVATPQTLKSVMLKLAELRYMLIADDNIKQSAVIAATRSNKFLRKLVGAGKKMGLVKRGQKKMKEHERADINKQIEVCIAILQVFKTGLVLMDEVDMLLHPLRSELRWPLGLKAPLDLTEPFGHKINDEESIGMRWRICWHLISAVVEDHANLPFQEIAEARACIEGLKTAIKIGADSHAISLSPHFVILNRVCYQQALLPHLTRWSIVFIRSKSVALQVPDSALIAFLENHGSEEVTRVLPDREVKVLVLFRQWLHVLLPFVFSRKHRVEFGLLPKEWITPGTPKSRKMLAVPFVGKDRPSPTSEFSHPDVLIGLSLIAYRLNGLRREDLRELILTARDDMEDESGKPFFNRRACQRWVRWIGEIGGRVRGFSWAGISLTDIKERDNTNWREFPDQDEVLLNSVWPLELVDVRDKEQMEKLFVLLNKSVSATVYYLFNCAFVEALDHTPSVLVASGQELGGDGLFGTRMGFSGTPNDLLPKPMGSCVYDAGCDGRIAATLTSNAVVTGLEILDSGWTPVSLLNRVVQAAAAGNAHALIDCGALVTNLNNFEVANILLDSLPAARFDAVVFVSDDEDERLVLDRHSRKIIPFAQSGLPRNRCFTFYDQIHTTGIDIEQPLGCTAILTLGKDSTFRDYAQAAYRMRGLGDVGQQKLSLLVSPQVNFMINQSAPSGVEAVACRVLGWTVLNSLASEVGQYMLLCQQNVENLWRSSAWEKLATGTTDGECLDVLKEPVDYVVDTDLGNRETRYAVMQKKLKNYSKWLDAKRLNVATNILLDLERVGRSSQAAQDGAKAIGKIELDAEQINENEITVEEEQEVTVQTQLIEELTVIAETDEMVQEKNFSREGESVTQWKLSALLDPIIPDKGGESNVNPFYPLKTFSVYSGIMKTQVDPIELPNCMLMSSNYYRPQWRLSSVKRLKNVIVVLEYVPDENFKAKQGLLAGISALASGSSNLVKRAAASPSWLSDPLALLDEALTVLDLDAAHSLTAENMEDALDCLFLDRGPASPLHPSRILKGESSIALADFKAVVTAWYLNKRMMEINEREEKRLAVAANPDSDLLGVSPVASHNNHAAVMNFEEPSRTILAENEQNRYFAIVTLAEAEYLRSAMHRLSGSVDCPVFALRVPGLLTRPLDVSHAYVTSRAPSNPVLPLMADQVARFVDCDPAGFTSAQITLLMKTLASVPYEKRKEWYLRNMQCRVRPTKPWQQLSIARLFVSPQDQAELQLEAALERLQTSLVTRSIDPKNLFVSWDIGRKAKVAATDVVSGIQALQISGLSQVDINRVVRKAENQYDGVVTVDNWLRLFPESMIQNSGPDVYDTGFKVISADQGLLTELGGITDAHRLLFQMLKETDVNARYKVKLMPHDSVKKLWSSSGLNCPAFTVWEPTQLASGGGLLHARSHSVRERVCLGHLVTFNTDKTLGQCTVFEIRDMFAGYPKKQQGETLEDFIEKVFPRPSSYRLVWAEKTNAAKPLYVWRPVPRNEVFQAVGVVCTVDPKEPSLDLVRTIPRQWLAREIVDIKDRSLKGLTWKDSGRRIWQQELLSVMDADKEFNSDVFPMWQILADRFFLASGSSAKPPIATQPVVKQPERSLLDSPVRTGAPEMSLLESPAHAKRSTSGAAARAPTISIPVASSKPEFSLLDSPTFPAQPGKMSQSSSPKSLI